MKNHLALAALAAAALVTACNRVDHIGRPPSMTEPRDGEEFRAMTTPEIQIAPETATAGASLWTDNRNALLGDHRAAARGDIMTVVIEIDDKAEMSNSTGRTRSSADNVAMPQMMGLPQRLSAALPQGASATNLADAKASSAYKGAGNISRRDKLTLRVAATVIEKLPNGVLRIEGTQEVRVNYEMRELTVAGFVRPSDIDRNNEIAYDRIAGARISYGGRGQISDVQQPRYGQQVADILLPY